MRLSEVGEFGLIHLIQEIIKQSSTASDPAWQRLLIGSGDDAAAWQEEGGVVLATTDTLIQGVHFEPDIIAWDELGWKALAVNLSDIAAMGGTPRYAMVSLSCPGDMQTDDVATLVRGMSVLASRFGVALVGGNVASAPLLDITVALYGSASDRTIMTRSAALVGDLIAVTGNVGGSAGGLAMLKRGLSLDEVTRGELRRCHFNPVPRVAEGAILASHGITTAIDISDGLVADLEHVCEASNVGATVELDRVPVHRLVREHFPDHMELALYGGEDYELLFAGTQASVDRVRDSVACPVTVIGSIGRSEPRTRVRIVDSQGKLTWQERRGWDHFRYGSSGVTVA